MAVPGKLEKKSMGGMTGPAYIYDCIRCAPSVVFAPSFYVMVKVTLMIKYNVRTLLNIPAC
jgi:hypothetical protein